MAISKNTIKFIKSLRLKKFRQKYNIFVVEGDKISKEVLIEAPALVEGIYALPNWLNEHAKDLPESKQHLISEKELEKISSLSTPNQVLLLTKMPVYERNNLPLASSLSLYLDGIQDPGNMGTILRIADWFGIQTVLCSSNCVDIYNPKVVQATMGAFLRVAGLSYPLEEILDKHPDLPVFGAAMDGENIFSLKKPEQGLIVIGNEGNGMAASTQQLITQRIAIPAAANSRAESLNAAVATGIICAIFRGTADV